MEVREKSLVIIKRHLTGPPLHPLGLSSRPAHQLAGGDIAPQSPFVGGTHFDLQHQTGGVVVVVGPYLSLTVVMNVDLANFTLESLSGVAWVTSVSLNQTQNTNSLLSQTSISLSFHA